MRIILVVTSKSCVISNGVEMKPNCVRIAADKYSSARLLGVFALATGLWGCPNNTVTNPDAAAPPADSSTVSDAGVQDDSAVPADAFVASDSGPRVCAPAEITPCLDEQIAALDLFDNISPALITEEGTTSGEFQTWIDAQGGGRAPTQSFVYARFTATGLEKVEVSDEDSFDSTGWDISFRRFVIRVNSGMGGPSCVAVARTAPATEFESLTSVPEGVTFNTEQYFTDSCEIIPDGSGLGSPNTLLAAYWTYPGCVSMTGNVYIIRTAEGRHVKLEVIGFYPLDIQAMCEETMTLPMPSNAANVRIRWAFLD